MKKFLFFFTILFGMICCQAWVPDLNLTRPMEYPRDTAKLTLFVVSPTAESIDLYGIGD